LSNVSDELGAMIIFVFFSVCLSAGLIASYYRRPMFPEFCSGTTMDDKVTYNTMVRIVGSFTSLAMAFQAIMLQYGWSRVALLCDMQITTTPYFTKSGILCAYGCQAIIDIIGLSVVIPVHVKSEGLTSSDYFSYLDTVRRNARGKARHRISVKKE
jgi:hypothetical protein